MSRLWDARRRLRNAARRARAAVEDRIWPLLPGGDPDIFVERPFALQLEFTNLCNANCVFCPYELQARPHERMSDAVFHKAVADYVAIGGGSVDLTPTVGDALIHPQFLERVRFMRAIPRIDRITLTTNAILVDRYGADELLDSGLSRINISIAGFDPAMYERVYRSPAYAKVRANIEALYEANSRRAHPVPIFLCLRPDRPWKEVLDQPDFQAILRHRPEVEYTRTYSRSGGLVTALPEGMTHEAKVWEQKRSPCKFTFSGLMVRADGKVQVCACESSVNAPALVVGDIMEQTLQEIWDGDVIRALRDSFGNGTLNANCAQCDQYYAPAEFRSRRMREYARTSRRRRQGEAVRHADPVHETWQME